MAMAKSLTPDQRRCVAEKFMEWGNLVFAGFVVAQVFSIDIFDYRAAVLGVVLFAFAYGIALRYMRGGD